MLSGFLSHTRFLGSPSVTCLGNWGSQGTFLGSAAYFQMILEGLTSCLLFRGGGAKLFSELRVYLHCAFLALGSPGKSLQPRGFCLDTRKECKPRSDVPEKRGHHVLQQCAWSLESEVMSFPCSETFRGSPWPTERSPTRLGGHPHFLASAPAPSFSSLRHPGRGRHVRGPSHPPAFPVPETSFSGQPHPCESCPSPGTGRRARPNTQGASAHVTLPGCLPSHGSCLFLELAPRPRVFVCL